MTRTLLATTLLLAIGTAHAQSVDAPPSTPGNPAARAYGPTSGGISWQRSSDDRRVVGYEITRDGNVLGVRDTLSYVAEDLRPGRSHSFVVVAIDSAGQRSGRAIIRIETPDARPNRPSGLAADVYSATAAGIAWERSDVVGERYEVKRDGEIVATATTGTSYVDTTLSNRRPYLFEVIAVNRQGQRSTAARLFVQTTDGSTAPPMASGPIAPSGLRSIVYSATAGAIAWNRSSGAGLRYEIFRDSQAVATTNGTSHVDESLMRGQSYRYAVIAVDPRGNRSDASIVSLVTPGGESTNPEPSMSSGTTIGVENREEVLSNVLAVIDASVYGSAYEQIETALLGDEGRTVILDETSDEAVQVITSECEGGGRIVQTSSGGAQTLFLDVEVDACRIDGTTFDGQLRRNSIFADGAAGTDRIVDLVITRSDGDVVSLSSSGSDRSPLLGSSNGFQVLRYEANGSDGPVLIEEASSQTFERNGIDEEARAGASFSARVTAPWTGGEPLEIRTEEPFAITEPPRIESDDTTYTSGSLVAEAADGSRLTIDAGNGDPSSVTLSIEADGSTSAFTVSVGDDLQIPCIGGLAEGFDEFLACSLEVRLPL